jgi:hypothetical protein
MNRFHPLEISVSIPESFTFPFCYEPHPACIKAAEMVQEYISSVDEWQEEINKGKMFGVLIAEDAKGHMGFLAAFSGLLANSNNHPYFVPAVYDILQPNGYFKTHEEEISNINRKVKALESSSERKHLIELLEKQKSEATEAINAYKAEMAEAKKKRDRIRSSLGVQECRSVGVQTYASCRGGSAYPPEKAIENAGSNRADTLICPYSNQSTESNNLSTRQLVYSSTCLLVYSSTKQPTCLLVYSSTRQLTKLPIYERLICNPVSLSDISTNRAFGLGCALVRRFLIIAAASGSFATIYRYPPPPAPGSLYPRHKSSMISVIFLTLSGLVPWSII